MPATRRHTPLAEYLRPLFAVGSEFALALQLITEILNRYRFADYRVRLSLRGTAGKYVQDPEKWEQAEAALRAALEVSGVDFYDIKANGYCALSGCDKLNCELMNLINCQCPWFCIAVKCNSR